MKKNIKHKISYYPLNEPQLDSLKRIRKLAFSCRWINVQFRDNGEFKEVQADFLRKILIQMAAENDPNANKIIVIDGSGWPVESIEGRWFVSLLRKVIFGKKLMLYKTWLTSKNVEINFPEEAIINQF